MIRDEERELVERCVRNDRVAWGEFVERYSGLVYSSVHHTLRSRGTRMSSDEVADLHNGIFLAFYEQDCRKLQQFDGRCRLTSWVKVVSVNYTIDRLRQCGRFESLDEEVEGRRPILDSLQTSEDTADQRMTQGQDIELLREVIASLSPPDRKLLEMIFFEERPFGEIASELNTTLGAVYTRKNRLLKKLQGRMQRQVARQKGTQSSSSRAMKRGEADASSSSL